MPRYTVKVVYPPSDRLPQGRNTMRGDFGSWAEALEEKLRLMKKTQEEDTEYYIVPLDKNRKGKT